MDDDQSDDRAADRWVWSTELALSAEHLWELVMDRAAQSSWLGFDCSLGHGPGDAVRLDDGLGHRWYGDVARRQRDQLLIGLAAGSGVSGGDRAEVSISVGAGSRPGRSVVTVVTLHLGRLADIAAWRRFWERCGVRLEGLVRDVKRRRRRIRQAVVVVHGIGEQEPGTTLRSFIDGLLADGETAQPRDPESWWKPDRTSRLFELRRVTIKATEGLRRPTTDVFELYWAHMIRDTTMGNVISWVRHLMLRRRIPSRFRVAWVLIWLIVLAIAVLAVLRALGHLPGWVDAVLGSALVAGVALTAWRLVGRGLVIHSLGDAARYLAPRPGNIAHRQAIREAGIDLLDRLHDSGRYDRIVLVGHSLGSVIAYDLITHYWINSGHRHARLSTVTDGPAITLNKALTIEPPATIEDAQELQFRAWKGVRRNGQPWLITDLVTMGSPLSMGAFLLASSDEEFERAQTERRLPRCPPHSELDKEGRTVATYDVSYRDRTGTDGRSMLVYNHGAPFAVTRWTNLHFAPRLLRDPIGGPVRPQFGDWVRDVPLRAPTGRRFGLHSQYWRAAKSTDHLDELRDAVSLDVGHDLLQVKREQSALLQLDGRSSD